MTIETMITDLLDERAKVVAKRDALTAAVETRGDSTLTETETETFKSYRAELATFDARATDLRSQMQAEDLAAEVAKRAGGAAIVKSEPLTYRKGGPNSYFRDLAKANAPGDRDDVARERLVRHAQEMAVETRANMNRTDGTGGDFVPPLWLINQYLPLARAGRVTADLCRLMPLPGGTDSINLPRVTTGAAIAEQADGGSVQKTDITTGSVSAAVTTQAGQQVFAMQLLDQSPINFDEVVFQDLLADLAVKVDTYVLNKAAIGILNVTGILAITYTDATPTVPELYPKVADGIQQMHTNRYLPPQAIVMHPRRWAWHLASLDSSNRPLVVPNAQGPYNAFAGMTDVRSEGAVGSLQGLPVYVDPNVPINLGAGTNEDRVILARFDDLYLYESPIRSRVLFETDADTLSVRLQVWEYMAFLGSRYPKAIAVVSGTGLITPTF